MRVSLSLTAERGRIRAAALMLFAIVSLAVAGAVAAPSAHAAFTLQRCEGSAIEGQGSSAQNEAQLEFWTTTVWRSAEGCGSSAPAVRYAGRGSGCGIASIGGEASSADCQGFTARESGVGFRAASTRYAGSDAPLTTVQQANANANGGANPGLIHQIPVASFAVAIIVHFPDRCRIKDPGVGSPANGAGSSNGNTSTGGPNDPPNGATGDTYADETLRVHISAAEMEAIWDGTAQTWGNIVPEADLEGLEGTTAAECAAVPVTRIVRFDGSGTTFNFKSYLSLLPGAPTGLWTSAPVAGDNANWPISLGGEKRKPSAVNGSKVCEDPAHICTGLANGGGEVAAAVTATNGSIGYADLATARKKGFFMERRRADHLYWIPMQTISPEEGNRVGATYAEPTETPISNLSASPEGADCTNADYRGYPTGSGDLTLGSWENSIATGATAAAIAADPIQAYPVCGLTYDFAWDDDATVYGTSQAEQEKARTVKDYLEAVESQRGQFQLALHDYGTLPLNVIEIAQNGVKAIGWNKSAGSGGGAREEARRETQGTSGGTQTTTSTPAPPSNQFSITSAKIKNRKLVVSLTLPGAGKIGVRAAGVGSANASVSGGNGSVTLSISKAVQAKVAKAKGHKLKVKITVTFTPTGGTAATKTKTITITKSAIASKQTKKKKRGHKKG